MRLTLVLLLTPALAASLVIGPGAQAADPANPQKAALDSLLAGYWQTQLKHDPEMASAVGDQRYDDQLSDYSVEGYNAALDRGRSLLDQLGLIDTAGLPEEEKRSKDQLVNRLIQEQADAASKPWELPISDSSGLPFALPQLAAELPFTSQADYEHYLTRLKLVPAAFSEITTSLMTGMDDHHVLAKSTVETVVARFDTFATQKPEDSVFAQPLKKFPAGISATEQADIREETLKIITRQLLPAYARLGKFLQAQYEPAAAAGVPASSYNATQAAVLESRAKAEKVLGPKFDLKAFHDQVKASISLSPEALAQALDTWITQQK